MNPLINYDSIEVKTTINILLKDKSTKQNIIWATDTYNDYGMFFADDAQITKDLVSGAYSRLIQPRVYKASEDKTDRTRKHAEVFTPSWMCNLMNNFCDEEWFGRKDFFNVQNGEMWVPSSEKIEFPEGKTWKEYVDSRRFEITCGEAPYLVSRYDTSTGEIIDINNRIGILDRKLRVVKENAADETEWIKWAYRVLQSVYGYEYQGDNLLVARINLLYTFSDYFEDYLKRKPTELELKKAANIIAWNIWEMCDAAINVITEYKCFNLDDKLIDALLFDIARDNECETIIEELVNYLDLFELLAKKSIGSKYVNTEWQFAKHLGDCKVCNQELLSAFIESYSEYASRMALWTMSQLNPDAAEKYAIKFWNREKYSDGTSEDEYQKIMALSVLEKIKSSKLEEYLDEALKSNYKMLIFNAEKII